ncbi:MAG: MgtC/SapB family protein [Candidatus Omnitrophica bacterium]|nr:MgtC/SapB family protein [Candidatus Omnitrophota bacterium]
MGDIELVIRLSVAIVLGGFIGFERELHGKVAGFRTHALVALGSALIMLVSIHMFEVYHGVAEVDPGRIAAQVVTGVGFLGAGTIIRSEKGIHGLTTAAGLWTASGIGLASGLGFFRAAFAATAITLVVLIIFSKIGRKIGARDV